MLNVGHRMIHGLPGIHSNARYFRLSCLISILMVYFYCKDSSFSFLSWRMMSICFYLMHWHVSARKRITLFKSSLLFEPKAQFCWSCQNNRISKIELVNPNSQGFDLWEISKVTFLRKEYSNRCFPFKKEFHG